MEVTTLGKNTITVCAKCDELIVIKGDDGFDHIGQALKMHIAANAACKAYYDSLPTLEETLAEMRAISQARHAAHACIPATCKCICGCGLHVTCGEDLSNGLCWTCALRVMRDDDDHGEISQASNPPRRFFLERIKDETGVSRTGRVLEGVLWQNGEVTVQWRPPHSTSGFYHSMEEFLLIHVDCHPSCNVVRWIDREAWHCFDCGAAGMEGNFCSRCGSPSTGFHPAFEGWEPTKRYETERELDQLNRRRMELVIVLDGEK